MTEPWCIVLLGSPGSGKSSLANTILEVDVFEVNDSPTSGRGTCVSKAENVNGRELCLIDTPDYLDPKSNDIKQEIHNCLVECAPGPHALLFVLKVDRLTWYNDAIIDGYVNFIIKHFSEDALTVTTVVFTHGEDLPGGMRIEDWITQNTALTSLVQKCGGRCHVFDNKHWNNSQDPYRNNQVRVRGLLRTIEETVENNGDEHYCNKTLENLEKEIQQEIKRLREIPGNRRVPKKQIRANAKENIKKRGPENSSLVLPIVVGCVGCVACCGAVALIHLKGV